MKSKPRFFTLDEANRLIPEIDVLLQHLMLKKETYARRHDEVFMHELLTSAEHSSKDIDESTKALEKDYLSLEEDMNDLEREMHKITERGCLVHDLETGCVDFLSKKDGELICYCWKVGEPRVQYFHRYHSTAKERVAIAS